MVSWCLKLVAANIRNGYTQPNPANAGPNPEFVDQLANYSRHRARLFQKVSFIRAYRPFSEQALSLEVIKNKLTNLIKGGLIKNNSSKIEWMKSFAQPEMNSAFLDPFQSKLFFRNWFFHSFCEKNFSPKSDLPSFKESTSSTPTLLNFRK